jgi:hypothetical protein
MTATDFFGMRVSLRFTALRSGGFRAQNCQYSIPKAFGIDTRKIVQLTTSPAIEPNAY